MLISSNKLMKVWILSLDMIDPISIISNSIKPILIWKAKNVLFCPTESMVQQQIFIEYTFCARELQQHYLRWKFSKIGCCAKYTLSPFSRPSSLSSLSSYSVFNKYWKIIITLNYLLYISHKLKWSIFFHTLDSLHSMEVYFYYK